MPKIAAALITIATFAACGSNMNTPSPPASGVDGTWTGTGSDSFSAERVTWILSQSGSAVSGTVEFNAVDPADGSCGSCHKVKKGTVSGSVTDSTLTVSMKFPAGGDVPAPICVTDLSASGSVADRRIALSYVGTDSCEGTYSNGVIELNRQP